MATYGGVRVSDSDALRLRGIVAAEPWRPTQFRTEAPDEMVDALVWAIAELAGEHDETRDEHFEELHPRGPGGKFRTIAERVLHALKQHHASGGKGPDPLKDFNREQLRKVAKARGIDLPRGASIEHIKAALLEHVASTHTGKPDLTPGKPDVPAKKAVKNAAIAKTTIPGNISEWQPTLTADQHALYELSQQHVSDRIGAGNPHNGRTELLTTSTGQRLVFKAHENRAVRNLKEAGDAEQLSALVSDAVGVETPTILRTGKNEWYSGYVDKATSGVDLVSKGWEIPHDIVNGGEGRKLGLLDLLIKNGDRNPSNWYRRPDGTLVAIDHGWAFTPGESPKFFARRNEYFSGHFAATMDDNGPNDISAAEASKVRQRLEKLREDFVRLGHEDWWTEMMGTMDQVAKWARP
jgi:hypothetical protein